MKPRHGFTLIEVMVTTAVLCTLAAATSSLVVCGLRSTRQANDYTGDVLGCSGALRFLEQDLRAARAVEVSAAGDALSLLVGLDTVAYSLRPDGRLSRRHADQSQDLAGNLGAFEAARDGMVLSLSLKLKPRAQGAVRQAVVETRVFLRNVLREEP